MFGFMERCVVNVKLNELVIEERGEANVKFHGEEEIVAKEILGGKVRSPAREDRVLLKTLKAVKAQGADLGDLPRGKGLAIVRS